MGRATGLALLLAGALCIGSVACSSDATAPEGDPPATMELTGTANGTSVDLAVRQALELTLQTIGPGSYLTPTVSSLAVEYRGVSTDLPQNPGGPQQLFTFEAVATGEADIEIQHSTESPPFHLRVVVH